jgi:hypothetical protein
MAKKQRIQKTTPLEEFVQGIEDAQSNYVEPVYPDYNFYYDEDGDVYEASRSEIRQNKDKRPFVTLSGQSAYNFMRTENIAQWTVVNGLLTRR